MSTTHREPIAEERRGSDTLADRMDIADLVYRHYACLDEHRFDDMRRNFCEDVETATPLGNVAGRETVLAQISSTFAGYARLHHTVGNVLVELDSAGGSAEVRCNVVAAYGHDDLRPVRAGGGVVRLAARREQGSWRIARLEITPQWRIDEAPAAH